MTIGKDLNMTKKKLNCLRMKMCRGVRLRRVKVKSIVHKWQMRENTILTNLSSKHEVCFMISPHLRLWTHVCGTLTVVAQDT